MPQKLLLPIIFLITFCKSEAQVDTLSVRENHKMILSLSAGMGIPVGKFSIFEIDSSKGTTNISGIPQIGINGKIDLMYLFSGKMGVTCTFYSSANKSEDVDSAALFYDPCPTCHGLGGGNRMTSYSYDTKNWYTNSVLAGIIIMLKHNNPILNLRINGGIQQVKSPESHLNYSGYIWQINWFNVHPYTSSYVQPQMISYNFVFDAEIDLQFNIKKKLGLIICMDYMTSRASFNDKSTYTSDVYDGVTHTYSENEQELSFTKNINLLNLNVGLCYELK